MTCFRPVQCWRPLDGGPVSFTEKRDTREIQIPCGQCIGCRIRKREGWAIRCLLESKLHQANSFITLTYSDDNLPMHGSLIYSDFQRFMHRLRKRCGPTRFFMCGEYGDSFDRPHFHALLFGLDFGDKLRANSLRSDSPVYRSATLERLWPFGFSSIGDVTYASARYVAAYTVKKISGPGASDHYRRVDPCTGEIVDIQPEFARMSLRPGIGAQWLEQHWRDLYTRGVNSVIVNGSKKPIPRYFDKRMDTLVPLLMDEVEYERYCRASDNQEDCTRDRLAVREQVELAKHHFNEERKNKPCVTKLWP